MKPIIIFSILLLSICSDAISLGGVYTEGVREAFETTEDIHLWCVMLNEMFPNKTSSCLSFKISKFVIDRNSTQVEHTSGTILNSTTIEYIWKKPDPGKYQVMCTCDKSAVNYEYVYVGNKPENVTDFKCIGNEFTDVRCEFKKPHNWVNTAHSLSYNMGQATVKTCELQDTPGTKDIKECTFKDFSPYFTKYNFTVKSTNKLLPEGISQTFLIDYYSIVRPPTLPVKFYNKLENSVSFNWNLPKYSNYYSSHKNLDTQHRLEFQFLLCPSDFSSSHCFNLTTYDCDAFDEPIPDFPSLDCVRKKDGFTGKISNLRYSHQNYSVQFRAKMVKARNDTMDWWSVPFNETFETKSKIPDNPPRTHAGSFYIHSQKKNVTLYWKGLKKYEYNGPEFGYDIQVFMNGNLSNVQPLKSNLFSATYAWNETNDYRFIIRSKNLIGKSVEYSEIVVNKRRPLDFYNVYRVTSNSKKAMIFWDLKDPEVRSFTVFWCRQAINDDLTQCSDSIYFENVDSFKKDYISRISVSNDTSYNYGVASNYDNGYSSGIVWNSCPSHENTDAQPITPKNNIQHVQGQLNVEWEADCRYRSIIYGYIITYCQVDVDDVFSRCLPNTKKEKPVPPHPTESVIDNLKPYTNYRVELVMNTKFKGKGPKGKYAILRTLEEAPSPPRNLEFINKSTDSTYLQWDPPQELNGNFKHYIITLKDDDNNTQTRDGILTPYYNLVGLKGFTNYTIYVQALQNQTNFESNPSGELKVQTLKGKPSKPRNSQTPFDFKNSIIRWNRPEDPNGNVDFYKVNMSNTISYIRNPNCTLLKFSCEKESNFFDVTISAFNVNQTRHIFSDLKYFEDFSEHFEKTCQEDESQNILHKYLSNSNYDLFESDELQIQIPCGTLLKSSTKMISFMIPIALVIFPIVLYVAIRKYRHWGDVKLVLPDGLIGPQKDDSGIDTVIPRNINDTMLQQEYHNLLIACDNSGSAIGKESDSLGKASSGYGGNSDSDRNYEEHTYFDSAKAPTDGNPTQNSNYISDRPAFIAQQQTSNYIKNVGPYVQIPQMQRIGNPFTMNEDKVQQPQPTTGDGYINPNSLNVNSGYINPNQAPLQKNSVSKLPTGYINPERNSLEQQREQPPILSGYINPDRTSFQQQKETVPKISGYINPDRMSFQQQIEQNPNISGYVTQQQLSMLASENTMPN